MNMVTLPVTTTIILYGRSLLLDTVELALRQNGRFSILRLSTPPTPLQLNNIPKGIIIYDQNDTDQTAVYSTIVPKSGTVPYREGMCPYNIQGCDLVIT